MDYRFKAEIELDEEKILNEGEYDLSEIYAVIRERFAEEHLLEVEGTGKTLTFIGTKDDDFAVMGMELITLYEEPWIGPYVVKMLWYNRDISEDYVEDVVEELEKYTIKYGE